MYLIVEKENRLQGLFCKALFANISSENHHGACFKGWIGSVKEMSSNAFQEPDTFCSNGRSLSGLTDPQHPVGTEVTMTDMSIPQKTLMIEPEKAKKKT